MKNMKLCIITTFSFNVWSNLKIKNKINTFFTKKLLLFFYNTGNLFLQNLFYFIIIWEEFFTPQNN